MPCLRIDGLVRCLTGSPLLKLDKSLIALPSSKLEILDLTESKIVADLFTNEFYEYLALL